MIPFYQEAGQTIYCGDNRDVLPLLLDHKPIQIVTDLPYGVGLADWDEPVLQIDLDMCRNLAETVLWFGAAPPRCMASILSFVPMCDRILIWHNPFTRITSDGCFWQWCPIYVWGKIQDLQSDVLEHLANGDYPSGHPAQKPESLMRKLILSLPSGIILDPWMGSGTTLVAARSVGREAIGIERNEKYCQIASDRLAQKVFKW